MPKIFYEMGMYKHPNILLYPQVLKHDISPPFAAVRAAAAPHTSSAFL